MPHLEKINFVKVIFIQEDTVQRDPPPILTRFGGDTSELSLDDVTLRKVIEVFLIVIRGLVCILKGDFKT